MSRLDGLPDNAFIEELRQLRIEVDDLKKDQKIKENRLNIALVGTVDLDCDATAAIPIVATVPHGLGFVPIPLVFFNPAPGLYSPLPNSTGFSTDGINVTLNNWSYASVDETNLYITFMSGITGDWGTFTYKYYLLQESAV